MRRRCRAILVVAAVVVLAVCVLTAGCAGSGSDVPTVPSNAARLVGIPPGSALVGWKYSPTASIQGSSDLSGSFVVYTPCPGGNLTDCAAKYAQQMTVSRPGVVVVNHRVTQLLLPTAEIKGSSDAWVSQCFRVTVPAGSKWQSFATLKHAQQKALLAIMPDVAKLLGGDGNATIQLTLFGVPTQAGRIAEEDVSSIVT
jgi:hypothetical protein